MDPRLWAWIRTYAPRYGLDPRAVAAVAMNESGGRFGAVGDGGTSYGPWQLHVGGALPPGRTAAWANSLPGVLYALQQMGSVAHGLHGFSAVNNIARRFERPADPASEVAVAMRYYNQHGFARGAELLPNATAGQYNQSAQFLPGSKPGQVVGGQNLNLTRQQLGTLLAGMPQMAPPTLNLAPLNLPTPQSTLAGLYQSQAPTYPSVNDFPTISAHPALAGQLDAIHSALLRA